MNRNAPLVFGALSRQATFCRLVATASILAQLLTVNPVPLMAQVAPSPGVNIAPQIEVEPPPEEGAGPVPTLAELQQHDALLHPPNPPIKASEPDVAPAEEPVVEQKRFPEFSAPPTDAEIQKTGLFRMPLRPTSATSAEDNTELSSALVAFGRSRNKTDFAPLLAYLEASPKSPWKASLLANVGTAAARGGMFTRSTKALREAWQLTKGNTPRDIRLLADTVAAELAKYYVRTGAQGELALLMKELEGRKLLGSARERVAEAKSQLIPIKKGQPAKPRNDCGIVALQKLVQLDNPAAPVPSILLNVEERRKQGLAPPSGRLSLRDLQALAKLSGIEAIPAKIEGKGAYPVPSVVHWKRGHFSALVERVGQQYRVRDPSLGADFWMSANAVGEEWSGNILAIGKELPSGWKPLGAVAGTVRGGYGDPLYTGTYKSPKKCPDPKTECKPCGGMPRHSINLLHASLIIEDTPVGYTPALGPDLHFTVTYIQGDSSQPYDFEDYTNVGRLWNVDWAAAMDLSLVGEPRWPSEVTVYLRGGGAEVYHSDNHGDYDQYPTYPRNPESHAQLKRVDGPRYHIVERPINGQMVGVWELLENRPYVYHRTLPEGTIEVYKVLGVMVNGQYAPRAFLTEIIHPQGAPATETTPTPLITHFNYNGNKQLTSVTDPTGASTILNYTSVGDGKSKINFVTDPFGRTASFGYDTLGRLNKITDAVGLVTEFEYEEDIDRITLMRTPYGETTFNFVTQGGATRAIEVTDPAGGVERVELWGNENTAMPATDDAAVPVGMSVANYGLNRFCTYHWTPKAMMMMGTGNPLDYTKAYQYRWMIDGAVNYVSPVISSSKAPLEGRVWFNYSGQVPGVGGVGLSHTFVGGGQRPTKVGRVVDQGSVPDNGLAQVSSYVYNSVGQVSETVDPKGRKTVHVYEPFEGGEVLTKIKQSNPSIANPDRYDVVAEYLYASDTYKRRNLPTTVKDAAGESTVYTYNDYGQVLTATRTRTVQGASPALQSETTTFVYGINAAVPGYARLIEVRAPGNVSTASHTYDSPGRIATSTDANGVTLAFQYDNLDRPLKTTYPDGTFARTMYDRLDPTWQQDRAGSWTRSYYDALQRVSSVQDPMGRWTAFDYCPCGALDAIIDGNGNKTTFGYDLQMRLASKTYPVPAGAPAQVIQYGYETRSGRLATMTDAKGQVTRYTYLVDDALQSIRYTNAFDQPLSPPTPTVSYTYESAGGQLDPYGRLVTMSDGTGQTAYTYHPVRLEGDPTAGVGAGKLATVNGPLTNDTISYAYDEYGRQKTRQINGSTNSVTRIFDALGRTSSETNPLGPFTYSYIGSTLDTMTLPSGFKTDYDVPEAAGSGNGDFRLSAIKHYAGATVVGQYDYEYSLSGNITKWTQKWTGTTTPQRYDLQYDGADELAGASLTQVSTNVLSKQLGYSYDYAGNRQSERQSSRQTDGTYALQVTGDSHNTLNQITSRAGGSGPVSLEGTSNEAVSVTVGGKPAQVWKNANNTYGWRGNAQVTAGANNIAVVATDTDGTMTSKTAQLTSTGTGIPSLTYDLNGNLLSDGTRTYGWDAANRLVKITHSGTGNVTEFTYDGLGRRARVVEKTNNVAGAPKLFVWDGLATAEERDANSAVTARYYAQGEQHIYPSYGNYTYTCLYQRDHLGSVRGVATTGGTTQIVYDYDLWGRRTKVYQNGGEEVPMGYTGHYYHSRSGLHLAPYRAYSAELGRWLSRDPLFFAELLPEGPNIYRYVSNSPASWGDPLGLVDTRGVQAGQCDDTVVCCDGVPKIQVPNCNQLPMSLVDCRKKHEESHIEDIKATAPDVCKGVPNGEMVFSSSVAEEKKTECKAHGRELGCLLQALKGVTSKEEREWIEGAIHSTKHFRTIYCK